MCGVSLKRGKQSQDVHKTAYTRPKILNHRTSRIVASFSYLVYILLDYEAEKSIRTLLYCIIAAK